VGLAPFYFSGPQVQLNWERYRFDDMTWLASAYGAAFTFVLYLADHFGNTSFIASIQNRTSDGLVSVMEVLKETGSNLSQEELLLDFGLANLLNVPSGEEEPGPHQYRQLTFKVDPMVMQPGAAGVGLSLEQNGFGFVHLTSFIGPLTLVAEGAKAAAVALGPFDPSAEVVAERAILDPGEVVEALELGQAEEIGLVVIGGGTPSVEILLDNDLRVVASGPEGPHEVLTPLTLVDTELSLTGSLLVERGARLVLDNVTLRFNGLSDGPEEIGLILDYGSSADIDGLDVEGVDGYFVFIVRDRVNLWLVNGSFQGVKLFSVEGDDVLIDGIEVKNSPSGVRFVRSRARLYHSHIFQVDGDGVNIKGGRPRVEGNIIAYNSRHGIYVKNSEALIKNNQLTGNGGYGIAVYGGSPSLRGNRFYNNTKGDIYREPEEPWWKFPRQSTWIPFLALLLIVIGLIVYFHRIEPWLNRYVAEQTAEEEEEKQSLQRFWKGKRKAGSEGES
jgi:parallel beta-helix repeat protein